MVSLLLPGNELRARTPYPYWDIGSPIPDRCTRNPVEEGRVGEDDATQVNTDVPGEPVELRGEVHESVQLLRLVHLRGEFGELWFLLKGPAEVAGVEPPHVLGDRRDLVLGHAECEPGDSDDDPPR